MSKNIEIFTALMERPASVVPTYGHASVHACAMTAAGAFAGSLKRRTVTKTTDAVQANWATPGSPWRPPVT